jgi:Aldehyde dehydrogenase family
MRLVADVLDEGSYLEAIIDQSVTTAMRPHPGLRRMLEPIGPVAVFGASNFCLAFSVPGGDAVSALAAGSPVVIKAHDSHPATSNLCAELLRKVVGDIGAPDGTVGLLHGQASGAKLGTHPAVKAVGFTGSLSVGREIFQQRRTARSVANAAFIAHRHHPQPTGESGVRAGGHHGGPWPSTNTSQTSVGPTAIRRFLRPLTWQDSPEHLLPVELREDNRDVPRRIDGELVQAALPRQMTEQG